MVSDDALIRRTEEIHRRILEREDAAESNMRLNGHAIPPLVFALILCNNCGAKLSAPDSVQLAALCAVQGWAVGEKGTILRSTNNGVNWSMKCM